MTRAALALAVLAGCFAPDLANGQIPCGPAGECPASMSCAVDKKCWSAGTGPAPCAAGTTRVDGVCTDIDECQAGTAACDVHATCTNTPGSYTCSCKPGWTGDGKTCTDVDECRTGAAACDAHATCTNTPGSYTCACNPGWTGDGRTCAQSFSQVASAGDHGCAVRGDGALFCWGDNGVGQLGLGMGQPGTRAPVQVGAAPWTQVAVASRFGTGGGYSCGIQKDGSLWCWGDDG